MQEDNYEILPSTNEQNGLLAISSATDLMMTSLDKVNNISSNINDMVHTLANMHVAVEQIEAELEAFKTATGAKIEKFKLQVPILDKQMAKISDRIDMITERILSLTDDDMSEETLKKQSLLMDTLSNFSVSFNNLVMKLMEF